VQVNRERFSRWFPQHTVYLMAYRGFGASEGEPTEAGITSDALALFDHVRLLHPEMGIDVIGRSLGSGVAAHVAARRPVRRLALVTPYDTLADVGQAHYRWLPVHLLARERYDSISNLASYDGPILVVRAGQDTVIPPANTQRLINSLPRPPKVLELRTADHSSIAFAPALARTMKLFFTTPGLGGVATASREVAATPRSRPGTKPHSSSKPHPRAGSTGHPHPATRSTRRTST
jgi:pimeloyl-ACP methyl ester carboxylesterase